MRCQRRLLLSFLGPTYARLTCRSEAAICGNMTFIVLYEYRGEVDLLRKSSRWANQILDHLDLPGSNTLCSIERDSSYGGRRKFVVGIIEVEMIQAGN